MKKSFVFVLVLLIFFSSLVFAGWFDKITGEVIGEDLFVSINLEQSSVSYNHSFNISWDSINAKSCAGFGHYISLKEGGLWSDLNNLPPEGSVELIADHLNYGFIPVLNLGIQCFDDDGVSISKNLLVNVTKPIYLKNIGCVESPAYNGDLCKGHRLITSTSYRKECYSYEECSSEKRGGTCIKSPLSDEDLCSGYRLLTGINDTCYSSNECSNDLNQTSSNNQTSPPISSHNYSQITDCGPFLGNENAPLKILFVNLGDTIHFNGLREDIINNQLKTISPFKENFNKMGFYSIQIERNSDLECFGTEGSLTSSGFACENDKIYEEIKKQCTIEDTNGIITIVIGESELGGSGGDIIYIGSNSERELEEQIQLSKNLAIHEIGHNFGLADLYYGTFYYSGQPSQFWGTEFSRAFLNVDGPGCNKWCESYKPVSEYTTSFSSQCLQFQDRNSCVSFGRDESKSCIYSENNPDCCVWSDEPFEYFDTNCVPALGSEDIGVNCLEETGCYYGAVYGNYAWRPVLNRDDSIMDSLGAEKFSAVGEKMMGQIFECCLSPKSTQTICKNFRIEFIELLQNYNWKKRIGSCGNNLIQEESNLEQLENFQEIEDFIEKNHSDEESSLIKEFSCDGCRLNDGCIPIGYRLGKEYCDVEDKLTDQLIEGSVCENSFECFSNVCISGKCVSNDLWQKFLSWLKKFFD